MTYGDIFLRILSEVTGQTKEQLSGRYDLLEKLAPRSKLDKEIPDAEAEEFLNKLRQEKDGIRAWLIKGDLISMPPQGTA